MVKLAGAMGEVYRARDPRLDRDVAIFHVEGPLLTLALLLVGAEVVILFVNGWVCPLTRLARRYSDDPDPAFDIYLPRWVVRHHRLILGILFVAGLVLNLIRNVRL
jgi:hypothetical protein